MAETARRLEQEGQQYFGNAEMNVCENWGYAKHAYILCIYFLLRAPEKPIETFYDFAITQCVKLQGDTDTNCAIAGGLVGAYVGIDRIDPAKVRKVLECTIETHIAHQAQGEFDVQEQRPKFTAPGEGCVGEMLLLVKISPK